MKIVPIGVELFNADRRTDMAQLIVTFCNLANALEKGWVFWGGTCNRVAQTCGYVISIVLYISQSPCL